MADFVTNTIKIHAKNPKINEILNNIKDEKLGLWSIDFNKLIPMPEELNIADGPDTVNGYNWYKDFIMVYTMCGTRKGLDLLNIPPDKEEIFLNVRKDIDRDI